MEGKSVADSSVIMAQMMIPQDANASRNVHGGVVVKIIDEAAGSDHTGPKRVLERRADHTDQAAEPVTARYPAPTPR